MCKRSFSKGRFSMWIWDSSRTCTRTWSPGTFPGPLSKISLRGWEALLTDYICQKCNVKGKDSGKPYIQCQKLK